jgi:hypothetical protein
MLITVNRTVYYATLFCYAAARSHVVYLSTCPIARAPPCIIPSFLFTLLLRYCNFAAYVVYTTYRHQPTVHCLSHAMYTVQYAVCCLLYAMSVTFVVESTLPIMLFYRIPAQQRARPCTALSALQYRSLGTVHTHVLLPYRFLGALRAGHLGMIGERHVPTIALRE